MPIPIPAVAIYEVTYGTQDSDNDFDDAMFVLLRPDGKLVPIDYFYGESDEIDSVRSGIHATVDAMYGFKTETGRAPLIRLNGTDHLNSQEECACEDAGECECGEEEPARLDTSKVWTKLCAQIEETGLGALVSLPRIGGED